MKFVPAGLSAKLGRQILLTRKHSPVILFGVGLAGTVTATVLACRATLKLEDTLAEGEMLKNHIKIAGEKGKNDKGATYTPSDAESDLRIVRAKTIVKVGKLYAPAIAVGLTSAGLLTGSHVVLTKRNTALLAAYGVLEKGFNEYRNRVRTELGDDKDREFRYGAVEKEVVVEGEHGHEVQRIKQIDPNSDGGIYARKFDEDNVNWKPNSEYSQFFIRCQQDWANNLLQARGHVFLSEVYDALGFERDRPSTVVGWLKNGSGDGYVDFGLNDDNQQVADFFAGRVNTVWLDFNVDGTIWDKI